jgi:hypothetical protein
MSLNRQHPVASSALPGVGLLIIAVLCLAGPPRAAAAAGLDVTSLSTGPRDEAGGGVAGAVTGRTTGQARLVWEGLSESDREAGLLAAMLSNIRRADYAGAESCRECHQENFEKWSRHPHRLMNALATDETVAGDFSGTHRMSYLGGEARFTQAGGTRRMTLSRAGVTREYRVTRTIGSRFTQYYAGLLVAGPEAAEHPARTVEHVLPLGWWLDRREWIPVVHIDSEGPDGQRWDPFAMPSDIAYDSACAVCHTTPTMGDWMLNPNGIIRLGFFAHAPLAFDVQAHLAAERSDLARLLADAPAPAPARLDLIRHIRDQNARQHAVSLGISCEACHNGSAEHVLASDRHKSAVLPHFFPVSSNVVVRAEQPGAVFGRSPAAVNFVCARCHSGHRPHFAGGMATWNSVEYSDAEAGYCYVRKTGRHPELEILSCTHCHDPHEPIGPEWRKTPDEDDASCLQCHRQYEPERDRFRHTRHAGGTAGARCLNCHMPRLNEGMQDVVRTHAISSPTWPSMIEANHPNACNLCHLDRSIDWTITWLSRWYRVDRHASYDQRKLAANYPDRSGPAGLGWLRSPHEPTRLVAVDALARAGAVWALPEMLNALDDPYLLNRQFARIALEQWLGVSLADHGYRFYQSPEERRQPLLKVREALLPATPASTEASQRLRNP